MQLSRLCLVFLALPLALSAISCGGRGTNVGQSIIAPKVPISWGPRSREFGGPGSAQSAVVVFEKAGVKGQDISFSVDRDSATGTYNQTYTAPVKMRPSNVVMHVRFHAQAGGLGDLVASADGSFQVTPTGEIKRSNGSALGTIKANGTISWVTVNGGQVLTVGLASDLQVSAFDTTNNLIAVSPGSIFYQVTPGTGTALVTSSGQLQGLTQGMVSVVATIDSVASYPATIGVVAPALSTNSIAQKTNAMVYDSATGHLWASVPSSDTTYGNDVIEIDPTSRAIVSSIYVGSEPNALALSDDNTTLYVSLVGARSVRRVDLTTRTAGASFTVTGDGFTTNPYAYAIAVQPGNPNVVAITRQDINDSGSTGPVIFNNGVQLPNTLGVYEGLTLAFTSPTTLWSAMDFSPSQLFRATVDGTGATKTATYQVSGGNMKVFGGNIYLNSGQVVDGTSGSLLGTFDTSGEFAVDVAANRAFCLAYLPISNSVQLSVFDNSTFRSITTTSIVGFTYDPYSRSNSFLRWGSKGLAFRDANSIYIATTAPGL